MVVSIIMILTALGYSYASEQIPRSRTRMAAMDFASFVNQCRSIAMVNGTSCRILLVEYDPDLGDIETNAGMYLVQGGTSAGDWDTLPLDVLESGSDAQTGTGTIDLASGQTRLRNVSIARWEPIGGSGIGNNNALVFDSRGFLSNPPDDFIDGKISVTFVNKAAEEKGVQDHWTVQVTRAGLAQIDANLRTSDDNFTNAGGTASSTTYDPDGPFGSP